MSYNTIANRVLISLNNKMCEFNRKLHKCLKSSFVYTCKDSGDKIDFFSMIFELMSLMNCEDFSALRDNYHSNIEKIRLLLSVENHFKLYFPQDSSILTEISIDYASIKFYLD